MQHRASVADLAKKFDNLKREPPKKPAKPSSLSAFSTFSQGKIQNLEMNLNVISMDAANPLERQLEVPPLLRKSKPPAPASRPLSMQSPCLVAGLDPELAKRRNIITEIVETEKSFLLDLIALDEIYAQGLKSLVSVVDHKLLFGALSAVISLSKDLSGELLEASSKDTIGSCFLHQMHSISSVYTNYCKNNEAALQKVSEWSLADSSTVTPEIKNFLTLAQVELKGRTNAWDLSSMLVKPLQRVLKYPLLIKRLSECTPPSHPDSHSLKEASLEIENVAELINEVKKRKDIVEKYSRGKVNTNIM